jgi:hypothetical protein
MPRRPCPLRSPRSAFTGFRFPPDVIILAIRWYLRYGLSAAGVVSPLAGDQQAAPPRISVRRRPILLMDLADHATTIKFLLRDRDSRFTTAFDAVLAADGIRILTSPPRAPRANAICERMIGTLRRELLDRILIVNEGHLRWILAVYLRHFNTARPHRTLRQLAPAQAENQPPPAINLADHQIRRRPILGGLTSEYQIAA